jgi:type VI protein secretion system component VasK
MVWRGQVARVEHVMDRLQIIGAAITGLAAIAAWVWRQIRRAEKVGEQKQRAKDAIETVKRVQRGQEAINRGRASGDSPADRLRRNDGKWQ